MGQGITTGLLVVVNNANTGVLAGNTAISSDTYGTVIGVGQTAQSLASVATVNITTRAVAPVPGAGLVLGTLGGAQNVYKIVEGINDPQKPVYQADVAGLVSNVVTIAGSYGALAAIFALPGAVLGAPAVLIGLTTVAVGAGIYQFVASVNGWTMGDDGSITPTTLTPEQLAQADVSIQALNQMNSIQLNPGLLDLELDMINSISSSFTTATITKSPLILDLGGDDILEGGAGSDIVADYGGGDNRLFGENYGEMSTLVNAGETAESINEKGDLLSAGSGIDQLYGSNRNDAIFSGGGNDFIAGGGGDDIILADSSVTSAKREWSVNNANFSNLSFSNAAVGGADNIYGGSGDDTIYGILTGYADNYPPIAERWVAA